MASIYFGGQLNLYHIQYGFRKIEHRHFNLKSFGFEVTKRQIFLKIVKKTAMRNRKNSLKGYPK